MAGRGPGQARLEALIAGPAEVLQAVVRLLDDLVLVVDDETGRLGLPGSRGVARPQLVVPGGLVGHIARVGDLSQLHRGQRALAAGEEVPGIAGLEADGQPRQPGLGDVLVGAVTQGIGIVHLGMLVAQPRGQAPAAVTESPGIADVGGHGAGIEVPAAYLAGGPGGQLAAVDIEVDALLQIAGAEHQGVIAATQRQARLAGPDAEGAGGVGHVGGGRLGVGPVGIGRLVQVLAEPEGAVAAMAEMPPADIDVGAGLPAPGQVSPPGVGLEAVEGALGVAAVALVGPGREGAGKLGVDPVVLQLAGQGMGLAERQLAVEKEVVDLGVALLATALAAHQVGLQLQAQPVADLAADPQVVVA